MTIRKTPLLEQLVTLLQEEIDILQLSLDHASAAATHPENKPVNKYDTRGLEAAYLAGAQRERLHGLRSAVATARALPLRDFAEDDPIAAPNHPPKPSHHVTRS